MQKFDNIPFFSSRETGLWLVSFLALCLNFTPLFFNFLWGNHDWTPLIEDSGLTSGIIEGRFSQYIISKIFLTGKILPVLNIALGFAFYAAALALLSSRFFNLSAPLFPSCVIIAAVATLPYITELLYFQFIIASQLTWPLVITLSLIAAKKATTSSHYAIYTTASTLALFTAIGGYPAGINLYVTATCLFALQEISSPASSLKKFIKTFTPFAISFTLALISLALAYTFLKQNNLMLEMYNNRMMTPINLLSKVFPQILLSMQSLLHPQPFFPLAFKILTTGLICVFIGYIVCKSKTFSKRTLILVLCFILLLCLKFSAWLIEENPSDFFYQNDPASFMVRADFFAVPVLILTSLSTLVKARSHILKNLAYIASVALLVLNINQNFSFSKTHILGFTAENKLLERLISRIEEHKNFNLYNFYTIVQAGELPLRSKYYISTPLEKFGFYTLKTPYTRHWIAPEYYNFYAPTPFVHPTTAVSTDKITPEMATFLTEKIKPWPSPDSLYVDNNYAIIALTPKGKTMLSTQFNHLSLQR